MTHVQAPTHNITASEEVAMRSIYIQPEKQMFCVHREEQVLSPRFKSSTIKTHNFEIKFYTLISMRI